MSRLLHAAARGARVQFYDAPRNLPDQRWRVIHMIQQGVANGWDYRIHPDDAHLQYGPISTALRETSQQDIHYLQDSTGVYEQAAIEDYATYGELGYCWDNAANATAMHKSLFLLILAEALADEGL